MEKVWLSAFLTPTTRTPSPSTHSQNDQQSNPVWRIRDFWCLSSRKYDPVCSPRIPDPDADFNPSRIPGSKKHRTPDPQHWSYPV
jgi:hypothetical protein